MSDDEVEHKRCMYDPFLRFGGICISNLHDSYVRGRLDEIRPDDCPFSGKRPAVFPAPALIYVYPDDQNASIGFANAHLSETVMGISPR